jgi:hypothetical protein
MTVYTQIERVNTQVHSRSDVDLTFEVVAHDGAISELRSVLLPFAARSLDSRGVSAAAEVS